MKSALPWATALLLALAPAPSARAAAPPPLLTPAAAAELFRKLDSDSFRVRVRADRALRAYGKAAVPLLRVEAVDTRSPEVRRRLREMIFDLTIDERVPGLVDRLGHHLGVVRTQADAELRSYGRAVVPLLKKELHPRLDQDRRARVQQIIADLSRGS